MPTKYQSLKPNDEEERMLDISKIFYQTQKFRVFSLCSVWFLVVINHFVAYNVRIIVLGLTLVIILFTTVDTLLIKKKLSKTTRNICFGYTDRRLLRNQSILILIFCTGLFLLLYWHSLDPTWWKSIITIIFSSIFTILVQDLFLKTIQEIAAVQIDENDFKK